MAAIGLLGVGAAPTFLLGAATASGLPSVSVPSDAVPSVSLPDVPVPVPAPSVPDPTEPVEDATGADVPDAGSSGLPATVGGDTSDVSASSVSVSGPDGGSSDGGSSDGGSSDGGSTGRDSGSAGRAARAEGPRPRMTSFETRPSRFKSRGDDHRGTTLRFRLSRAGLVRFTVFRLSPTCERVGSFLRVGERGPNEKRFSGRVDGRPLSPGTYRIEARPVARGEATTDTDRFVVVAPFDSVASASAQPSTCVASASASSGASAGSDGGSDLAVLTGWGGSTDHNTRTAGDARDREDDGSEEGGVAQFRESSPDVVGGDGENTVWVALVLAFCVFVGSLLAFLDRRSQ